MTKKNILFRMVTGKHKCAFFSFSTYRYLSILSPIFYMRLIFQKYNILIKMAPPYSLVLGSVKMQAVLKPKQSV